MHDETIVFLELSFHSTNDVMVAAHIEQTGRNETVRAEIRAWAVDHDARVTSEDDESNERTLIRIAGVDSRWRRPHRAAEPRRANERERSALARVLDYWLEQYRRHGQSVFRERLVIDVPLDQISGRHLARQGFLLTLEPAL